MYLGILPSLVNIYKQFGYFRPDSRQINQISDKSSIRLPFKINNTYIQHPCLCDPVGSTPLVTPVKNISKNGPFFHPIRKITHPTGIFVAENDPIENNQESTYTPLKMLWFWRTPVEFSHQNGYPTKISPSLKKSILWKWNTRKRLNFLLASLAIK